MRRITSKCLYRPPMNQISTYFQLSWDYEGTVSYVSSLFAYNNIKQQNLNRNNVKKKKKNTKMEEISATKSFRFTWFVWKLRNESLCTENSHRLLLLALPSFCVRRFMTYLYQIWFRKKDKQRGNGNPNRSKLRQFCLHDWAEPILSFLIGRDGPQKIY